MKPWSRSVKCQPHKSTYRHLVRAALNINAVSQTSALLNYQKCMKNTTKICLTVMEHLSISTKSTTHQGKPCVKEHGPPPRWCRATEVRRRDTVRTQSQTDSALLLTLANTSTDNAWLSLHQNQYQQHWRLRIWAIKFTGILQFHLFLANKPIYFTMSYTQHYVHLQWSPPSVVVCKHRATNLMGTSGRLHTDCLLVAW